jgi:hypothetical protein
VALLSREPFQRGPRWRRRICFGLLGDGRAVQLSTSWLLGERALKTALSMTLGSVSCALVSRKNWWGYMGGVAAGVLANTHEQPMLFLAFAAPLCGVCFGLLGRLGSVRAGRADGIDQRI